MGQLSAALKAALDPPGSEPAWLIEIAPASGSKRYAPDDVSAIGSGLYEGRALSVSPIDHGVSDDFGGGLRNTEVRVALLDHDRAFMRLVEGPTGDQVRDAVATLKLAHDGVVAGDWSTEFSGRLADWQFPEPFIAELLLRPDDLTLERLIPGAIWTITQADWPHAHADVLGVPAPFLYGKFDSQPYTNEGLIPCLAVDTTGTMRHLVCAGRANSIDVVYIDGVTTTTHTVEYIVVNGKLFTTLTWSSSPGEDAVVSVDCEGYETDGDGGGTLITNPATQLKHLLSNFLFGEYRSGLWLSDASELDAASFTAARDLLHQSGVCRFAILARASRFGAPNH